MRLFCVLLIAAFASSIYARPIRQSPAAADFGLADDGRSPDAAANDDDDISEAESPALTVLVDRFAQLMATHWQFDHLDSIKTSTYDHIASQMREHVQITMNSAGSDDAQQHAFMKSGPSDAMDLDILKAQIFGAIQAHIGGRLPVVWDQLGDKLGRQAIETYVRRLVLSHCRDDDSEDHVDHSCLVEHGDQLLAEIDRYVVRHLANVFDIMNAEFLPHLLQHTAKDLGQVLEYFNTAFLQKDDMRLSLRVVPWKQTEHQPHLRDFAALARNNPDHASDIVGYYANLARI